MGIVSVVDSILILLAAQIEWFYKKIIEIPPPPFLIKLQAFKLREKMNIVCLSCSVR